MPQVGIPELIIILVIVVIVFGVGKLPQLGGALGQGIREFRNATRDEEQKKEPIEAEVPSTEKEKEA